MLIAKGIVVPRHLISETPAGTMVVLTMIRAGALLRARMIEAAADREHVLWRGGAYIVVIVQSEEIEPARGDLPPVYRLSVAVRPA